MSEAARIDLVDRAPLTEKQQNVYESIMQYQRVNGYAPTIREICKMVGVASTSSVYAHLKLLCIKRLYSKEDGCFQSNSNLVRKVITLSNKVYVDVLAEFSKDGLLIPKEITWEDGRKYEITRVKDKRRAASTRAGGVGERYTCVVNGKEIFLFYEDNNMWFMERAGA
ncbi:MAG: LexA family protein [Agathobacter sp.]